MNPTTQVNKRGSDALSRKVATVLADRTGNPHQILADAAGNLPTRFELLKVGYWHTQAHGDIMISPQDLQQYYENFLAGYGRSGGDAESKSKLPINFGHDYRGKAAGWFNIAVEGDTRWAVDVEWSKAGKEGLTGGEWKFISAEFYPVGRGGWPDPLDWDHFVENVIDGAALTNIPLFSQLNPVMASAKSGDGREKIDVFVITASEKERSMNLQEILAKDQKDVTEAEKTFVAQHKEELTAEQQTQFGLEVTKKTEETKDPVENKNTPKEGETVSTELTEEQTAAVAASLKKQGLVMVQADRLSALEDTAKSYEKEKAVAFVTAHAARGAITTDQIDRWADRLMASRGDARKELEEDLKALPDHPALAGQQGVQADKSGDATEIAEELKKKTLEHQAKIKADRGTELTYGQAQDDLLRQDDDLRTRVEAARKVN